MDSGFPRNEGNSGTGFGSRNGIQIPACAGMTGGGAGVETQAFLNDMRGRIDYIMGERRLWIRFCSVYIETGIGRAYGEPHEYISKQH